MQDKSAHGPGSMTVSDARSVIRGHGMDDFGQLRTCRIQLRQHAVAGRPIDEMHEPPLAHLNLMSVVLADDTGHFSVLP